MSNEEFAIYSLCEEFHQELKEKFAIKSSAIVIAKKVSRFLNDSEMEAIVSDILQVKKRNGNASAYFCMLIWPILK